MPKKYSYVVLEIPEPFRSQILEYGTKLINKAHLKELEDYPHITVKCGLKTNDVHKVAGILGTFKPIRVMFGHTNIFMADDFRDTDCVKIDVYGESIRRMWRKLNLLPNDSIYQSYQPHCTLGFIEAGYGMGYIGTNPIIGEKVILDRVVFSPVIGDKKYITCNGEVLNY